MKRLALKTLGWIYRLLKRTPLIHLPFAKRMYYRVYGWIRPKDLVEITVEGSRLWVDPSDQGVASFLLAAGSYEPFEVSIVQHLLQDKTCFVDVGANIGYYTVLAARAMSPA